MSADIQLGALEVTGYDYDHDDQPVLLEVWIEKSTMNDELLPLCEEMGVNVVVGVGFESYTHVIELLRRAQRHDKPAHVLYISDFDPGGYRMPISVARQAQFWHEQLLIDVPLTIDAVVLTAEQVDDYGLPRAPVKVDEQGRPDRRFEEQHWAGDSRA